MSTTKFVIIGIGNIGKKYVALVNSFKDAELTAVVDTDFRKHKDLENLVPFFTSVPEFLQAKIPADVVCVCTPNGLHPEHTIACLNAGYHVVCEKPIALETQDVHQMMEAEEMSGKKVFAVMQNRYSPVAVWLKKLMTDKMLGEVLFLQINCFWNRNEQYYLDSSWRGTKQLGGGPLYSQFSHFIDLLIWLCGEPQNISSNLFTLKPEIKTEFDDSGTISFNLANGGRGTFNFTNAAYQANLESSLTIIGSEGNVKVGGQYMEKLDSVNLKKNSEIPVFNQVNQANNYQYYQGSADKHDIFLSKVIDCIKSDKQPEIGLSDELCVVHFIEQALLSVTTKSY
ncbi:Gfo/Idh/MocA family protein [Pedobacter arcticus]|uniref:Gfo/Idh/MocA family protein n=1 Tax=Pedobacter arcticus TaxID=752140 RepID=UPI0002D9FB2E|nr:Gfo/Idh/MocA family oxidoreductase [Pedobacter arcticus]